MSDAVGEARYRGRVTVGSRGRAQFHERAGGIGGLVWDALDRAGWRGRASVGLGPMVEVRIRVPAAALSEQWGLAGVAPEPRGERRLDDGAVCRGYTGPLHPRVIGGVRLVDSERRADDWDSFEDMLYSAGVQAGWLTARGQQSSSAEVPDVEVVVRVAREGQSLMAEEAPVTWLPIAGRPRRILNESDIGRVAVELAADHGDPRPRLVQHVACTRAEANRVMCGAVVPGERSSWLIAIQGRFVTPQPSPPHARDRRTRDASVCSVLTLVIDAETGAPTDSGSANEYPDLAAAGPVVTDYPADEHLAG